MNSLIYVNLGFEMEVDVVASVEENVKLEDGDPRTVELSGAGT